MNQTETTEVIIHHIPGGASLSCGVSAEASMTQHRFMMPLARRQQPVDTELYVDLCRRWLEN